MKLDDFSVEVADFVKKLFLVNKCSADSDVLLNKNNNKKNNRCKNNYCCNNCEDCKNPINSREVA